MRPAGTPSCFSAVATNSSVTPVHANEPYIDRNIEFQGHHLRLLRAGRLVRAERRGKQVFYVVDDEHIRCVLSDMVEHLTEETPASVLLPENS